MKKKTILLIIDIIVRAAFLLFAGYIIMKSKTDSLLYWAGYAMILFNGITTFFDDAAYKKKK